MEENGSITSFEAMSKLHIMSPRKRLSEINRMTPLEKKYEYSISHDPSGRKHVIKYVRYSIAK